ncbi:alpha/beta fold hydrolase [Pelosinus baikalensis]|uniref:Alpha/beta hydrolase n=1 Tax=Pelosinus baikalensis TaxID=2892015 RepID=A0ABS8HSV8_9FIRM|nr:alpha/beta hydrolase [Pelosinus baikalensis]MCC5466165.1 alpha/beta hydrolase [Pelosinus baikalensis]
MKCSVKDVAVNYEVYGDGKAVIMLHGYSPDHRLMTGCMEPVFEKRAGYKRIYIDLPGMGKTKGEDWVNSSDVVLDILLDFIDMLVPGENFLLAGESYGGYLSRGIIYKMPHRIDGLFLLCPKILDGKQKKDVPSHVVLKRDDDLLAKLDPPDAKAFDAMHVVQNAGIWRRYRDEILSGINLADFGFLRKLKTKFSFEDTLNETFTKPTLFLLGRQDASVGYKDAWNILDNYPRATFAVLDKAGHNLQLEQVEVFNCLVDEWITRVEEE